MEAVVHKSSIGKTWKDFYKAALFEDDNSRIPQRIADAETALAARAMELAETGQDEIQEHRAMENAWYFLRVLGSTLTAEQGCNGFVGTEKRASDHPTEGKSRLAPAGKQDLHTTPSSVSFCNE
jgi:hypothetical protein